MAKPEMPRVAALLAVVLATGCDALGIGARGCTLIGCEDGITVHLSAVPTGPYRVEIVVGSGSGGLSYAYDCDGGPTCQQDIFFPELVLNHIIVKVTSPLGSRLTEIPNPVYVGHRPNGPDCPPLCRTTTVTAQLPG